MTVGDNIKKITASKEISLYRISKETGISNSYLSDLTNNKSINPSIDIIKMIAKALDVSVNELINKGSD